MEALFHLIIQIIKIALLASFYATVVLIGFIIIGKIKPTSYFENKLKSKKSIWVSSGFIISIILFIYMFTYWGDHGLGDSARIPIGHYKEVEQINGIYSYIKPGNYSYNAMAVEKFLKANDLLIGKTSVSPVDRPKPYFSWNLKSDQIIFFDSKDEYDLFAKQNSLPKSSDFKTFRENYKMKWGGIKFWLLP